LTSWAEASLREAVTLLVEGRRHAAASDLQRLIETIDFDDLKLTRHRGSDAIIEATQTAETLGDLLHGLSELANLVGCRHATVHVLTEARGSTFRTRVVTTYPGAWIERYIERRYDRYDPVLIMARTAADGFYWSDIPVADPVTEAFLRDARAQGVGSEGFSQPVDTPRGDRLALTLATTEDPSAFRTRFECFRPDVVVIAPHAVDAFLRLASDPRPRSLHPTDAQMLLLRAIAAGEDPAALRTATFDGMSYGELERTVCVLFHTRTVAQAAVVAAQLGLLEDFPLSRPDILGGLDAGSAAEGRR
jgi:hypothetical protein